MTCLRNASQRLDHAAGLAAIMDAAYDGFEDMLAVLRAYEDQAGSLFAAFMLAAAAAAGRDAILFAPSLPPGQGRTQLASALAADPEASAGHAADAAAELGQLLAERLAGAGQAAADPADRAACADAARCAQEICGLLRRGGP